MLPGLAEHGYGYIHTHGGQESFQCDVATWASQEGLNWGLEALHKSHSRCDECQGVLYFMPDEPLRLRLLVEEDDLDEEEVDK